MYRHIRIHLRCKLCVFSLIAVNLYTLIAVIIELDYIEDSIILSSHPPQHISSPHHPELQ